MYENKFDETLDEVSAVHGLNWNEDSKIRIMARFLQSRCSFQEWENFLEKTAIEESNELLEEEDDSTDA